MELSVRGKWESFNTSISFNVEEINTVAGQGNFGLLWKIDLTWPLHPLHISCWWLRNEKALCFWSSSAISFLTVSLREEGNQCLIQRFPESHLAFLFKNYLKDLLETASEHSKLYKRKQLLKPEHNKNWCREDRNQPPWDSLPSKQLAGWTVIICQQQ